MRPPARRSAPAGGPARRPARATCGTKYATRERTAKPADQHHRAQRGQRCANATPVGPASGGRVARCTAASRCKPGYVGMAHVGARGRRPPARSATPKPSPRKRAPRQPHVCGARRRCGIEHVGSAQRRLRPNATSEMPKCDARTAADCGHRTAPRARPRLQHSVPSISAQAPAPDGRGPQPQHPDVSAKDQQALDAAHARWLYSIAVAP